MGPAANRPCSQCPGSGPQHLSLSLSWGLREGNGTHHLLFPQRDISVDVFSQYPTPRRANTLPAVCPWSSSDLCLSAICPWVVSPPSLQEQDSALRALAQPGLPTFKTPDFKPHQLQKLRVINLSFSQSMILKMCPPCAFPCVLCSFSSLSMTRAPFHRTHNLFLPQTMSPHFFPSSMWLASSLPLVVHLFCQSSGGFLWYSEWFDGYLVVLKRCERPRALLLSYHLSSRQNI